MMPIAVETPTASMTDPEEICVANPAYGSIAVAMIQPRMMPMTPPMNVSTTDSTRNWKLMSARLAPIALRSPI